MSSHCLILTSVASQKWISSKPWNIFKWKPTSFYSGADMGTANLQYKFRVIRIPQTQRHFIMLVQSAKNCFTKNGIYNAGSSSLRPSFCLCLPHQQFCVTQFAYVRNNDPHPCCTAHMKWWFQPLDISFAVFISFTECHHLECKHYIPVPPWARASLTAGPQWMDTKRARPKNIFWIFYINLHQENAKQFYL